MRVYEWTRMAIHTRVQGALADIKHEQEHMQRIQREKDLLLKK